MRGYHGKNMAANQRCIGLVALSLLVGCISHVTLAQQSAETVVKTLIPKQDFRHGEKATYKLTMQIQPTVQGAKKITVLERFKITGATVGNDGAQTQIVKFDTATVNVGGKDVDVISMMPSVTVIRSPKSAYSSTLEGGNAEGNAEIGGAIQQIVAMREVLMPRKAMKVGDTWKATFANSNAMIGSGELEAVCELLDREKVGGRPTLKVRFAAHPSGDYSGPTLKCEGSINYDETSGQMIHFSEKGSGKFAGSLANVSIEVERVDN